MQQSNHAENDCNWDGVCLKCSGFWINRQMQIPLLLMALYCYSGALFRQLHVQHFHRVLSNISQGRWGLRQLGGFSVVVVIVALFVPTECPVRGGGVCGGFRKALEKGYLEHLGSACCTDDMFEIFVRFGQGLCSLLPLFVNRQLSCPHTNSLHRLLLPPMHHRNLCCAKERALGV